MTRKIRLLAALLALVVLASACGGNGDADGDDGAAGDGDGDTLAEQVDLSGVELTVGSKEFPEQQILGQMAYQALAASGADVQEQIGLQGTSVVRDSLTSDEIDLYWEYTGTGWIELLGNTEPVPGEEEQFNAVAEDDLEQNGIQWFAMAPLNNTYALAVKEGEGPDINAISEIEDLPEEEQTLCAAAEFLARDDGLPGLEEEYGLAFNDTSEIELGLIAPAIGRDCTFGEVFATDGAIQAQDLRVLEDDQEFFPKYNVAMTMRQETYDENAEAYETLFGGISELLSDEVMVELVARVDVEGELEEDVAREFLIENNVIPE